MKIQSRVERNLSDPLQDRATSYQRIGPLCHFNNAPRRLKLKNGENYDLLNQACQPRKMASQNPRRRHIRYQLENFNQRGGSSSKNTFIVQTFMFNELKSDNSL